MMLTFLLIKDKGEELYVQIAKYPHEFSNILIDKTDQHKSADIIIRKSVSRKKQGLGSDQCLDVTPQEYGSLISRKTAKNIGANSSCTTPLTANILDSKMLPKCINTESALTNIREVNEKFREALLNTIKICSISSYPSSQAYFNQNALFEVQESYFTMFIYYGSSVVEEKVEQYIYDPGTLLTSVGGNMGLFLGFSCLSCFLSLINFCKENVCKSF